MRKSSTHIDARNTGLVSGASEFDIETAVVGRGDGHYDGQLSASWNIGDTANGGYALTSLMRALREESGHPDPLSVTTHFLRPIQGAGESEISTTLIRRGRSVSMTSGSLVVDGTERLTMSAVFGTIDSLPDGGPDSEINVPPPNIPPPEDCIDRTELAQGVTLPIASRVDVRLAPEAASPSETKPAVTEGWIRLRDATAPSVLTLPLFADAFPPSLFAKYGSVGWVPTIELTVHVRRRPASGWVQARFECDDLTGGRMIESGTLWDSDGHVVARSRQLGLLLRT